MAKIKLVETGNIITIPYVLPIVMHITPLIQSKNAVLLRVLL